MTIVVKHSASYNTRSPSRLRRQKLVPIIGVITVAFVLTMLWQGSYPVTFADLLRSLAGLRAADPVAAFIVQTFRLPRVLTAWMIGAGLGISGAMMQAITRNPLAEPGILGVNGGASVAALLVILFAPSAPKIVISIAAFLGAAAATVLLFALVPRRRISGLRLLLTGVAISSLLTVITQILFLVNSVFLFARIDYFRSLSWLVGGLVGWVTWQQFWMLFPWLAAFVPWSLLRARDLNLLALGDELAIGLGIGLRRQSSVMIAMSAAICAACVAVAGPVSFLGLIAPNVARYLLGSWQPRVLPASLMIGGVLMVTADLLSHVIAPWWDIPCGLLIAACGGPFLLLAIVRSRMQRRRAR